MFVAAWRRRNPKRALRAIALSGFARSAPGTAPLAQLMGLVRTHEGHPLKQSDCQSPRAKRGRDEALLAVGPKARNRLVVASIDPCAARDGFEGCRASGRACGAAAIGRPIHEGLSTPARLRGRR